MEWQDKAGPFGRLTRAYEIADCMSERLESTSFASGHESKTDLQREVGWGVLWEKRGLRLRREISLDHG